jgi:hypothetical protein
MRLIKLLLRYAQGLIASGKAGLIILGFFLLLIGFILATIGYIFKIGIKVFTIFIDESLVLAIKSYENIELINFILFSVLKLGYYYLTKFVEPLNIILNAQEKPTLNLKSLYSNFAVDILQNLLYGLIRFIMSLMILILSIYWMLTYVEFIVYLFSKLEIITSTNLIFVDWLKDSLTSLEKECNSIFGFNIFDGALIWSIRLIGFSSIFCYRYYRLKFIYKEKLNYKMIIPYKDIQNNLYWDSENVSYTFKWSYLATVLILLSALYIIYNPTIISILKFDLFNETEKISSDSTVVISNQSLSNKSIRDLSGIIALISAKEYKISIQELERIKSDKNIAKGDRMKIDEVIIDLKSKNYIRAIQTLKNMTNK